MSETLSIKLNIADITKEQLLADPQLPIEKLTAQQTKELKEFLWDLLEDKDGSPSIGNLSIKQLSYNDNDNNKGKFRLAFDIDRRFCCSDTQACQQDYIDFSFELHENLLKTQATYFNWSLNN